MIFYITDQNASNPIYKVSNSVPKFQFKNFKRSLPYVGGTAISRTTSSPNLYFG